MLVMLRKPRRRKFARRSIKNMDPGRELPKPAVETVHALYVTSPPPPATAAGWEFDRTIIVQYGFYARGKPWNCADGAAGITSTDGNPLAAGSGSVG